MESERDRGGKRALFAQGNLQRQTEHICEVEECCSVMWCVEEMETLMGGAGGELGVDVEVWNKAVEGLSSGERLYLKTSTGN